MVRRILYLTLNFLVLDLLQKVICYPLEDVKKANRLLLITLKNLFLGGLAQFELQY